MRAATMKSDQAYLGLRREIVTGEIPANAPIEEKDLAERYGLGRTPIREALKRLENEQLLQWPARRSPYVPEIGVSDLKALFEARAVLEIQVTRLAAERITDEEADRLEELIERQAGFILNAQPYEAAEIDLQFHSGIAAATQNRFLADASTRLNAVSLRLWHDTMDSEGMPEIEADHRAILAAVRAHDGDLAEKWITKHISDGYSRHMNMASRTGRLG
jgi:GntR family transcriptional regulator, rspAB operon transcriptional repressor